jgi:hypothetical protein
MTDWRVIGASVAGSAHIKRGLGCDDAHGWHVGDGLAIVAVADGAGSRSGTSAIGSQVAVEAVLLAATSSGFLDRYGAQPEEATARVLGDAAGRLSERARQMELPVDALATTLCVAILAEDRVTVAQVGDGLAAVEGVDGSVRMVAVADQFEYVNEVAFLTRPDVARHIKTFSEAANDIRGIALSSDGLRYKMLDDLAAVMPYRPFFESSWRYARTADASSHAIDRFLADVDDQTGDDLTLVLAVREYEGKAGLRAYTTPGPAGVETVLLPRTEQRDGPASKASHEHEERADGLARATPQERPSAPNEGARQVEPDTEPRGDPAEDATVAIPSDSESLPDTQIAATGLGDPQADGDELLLVSGDDDQSRHPSDPAVVSSTEEHDRCLTCGRELQPDTDGSSRCVDCHGRADEAGRLQPASAGAVRGPSSRTTRRLVLLLAIIGAIVLTVVLVAYDVGSNGTPGRSTARSETTR